MTPPSTSEGSPTSCAMPECREFAPIEDLTDELSEHVLAVNLKGLYTIIRASVPHVKKRGGGAIVTMSSEAGITGQPNLAAYCASKAV